MKVSLTLAKNSQNYTRKNQNFLKKFVEKMTNFVAKKYYCMRNASYTL
jgi:hypothetical protein